MLFRSQKDQNVKSMMNGAYLILSALKNNNWQGVIIIASSRGRAKMIKDAINILQQKFPGRDKDIIINRAEDSLAVDDSKYIEQKIINYGIQKFIGKFSNIENRLWTDETKTWFSNSDTSIPHDYSNVNEDHKETIKTYLKDLLSFTLPSNWLDDKRFGSLFNELKSLIGICSIAQGGDRYNLSLGCVVLLLGIAISKKNQQYAARLMNSVEWPPIENDNATSISPILSSHQEPKQAQTAILALLELLEKIGRAHV